MGNLHLKHKSLLVSFCSFTSEVPIRGANEQMKCYVPKNTPQRYNYFRICKTSDTEKFEELSKKLYLYTQIHENNMSYTYKYPRPAVTADTVVIAKGEEPQVLLVQRDNEPFKGCWAFPGGFMNMDETTEQCAVRELEEETGLKVNEIRQIGAYSKLDRDPRGRTITVAYLAIVDAPAPVKGQDDAAKAAWFPISVLPPLAFDHSDIIQDAIALYKVSLKLTQKL